MPDVRGGDRHRSRGRPPARVHDPGGARHGGRHGERGHQEGAGRCPRVPAHQPSARLPCVRQGRRVPAPGPDARLRPRREPLRRGEAPLREADHDQRPRGPRPRALHPLRPVHTLRQRCRRRHAHPLHRPRQPDAGQHLPRPPLRQLLQRQHGADLPGRRADGDAVPVQGPPVGPRPGGEHLHLLLRRLPHARPVESQRGPPLPGCRRRPGQLGMALRPRAVRLRLGQQRRAPRPSAGAARGRVARGGVGRGPVDGGRGAQAREPRQGRRARRRAPHQRERVRLGQAREGRDRHRPRRRPAR